MSARSENTTPAAEPAFGSRWVMWGVCLLLLALVLIVFGQCVTFEFVNYDDDKFVLTNNHILRGVSWENLAWVLSAGTGNADVDIDYWRPMSMASHMLDVHLFGLNAGAHHAVSVGLHALAVVALFLVLRSLTGMLCRSAFVAALFAIHPLHVESVAWVAERKDVLSGLFFVLAVGAYARFVRRPFHPGNYLLVVLLFGLGLMSKPMLVTLPCLFLLLDYWPLGRVGTVPWKRLLLEKAPLFAMSAVVAVLARQGPGSGPGEIVASLPWYWSVGNGFVSYVTYLFQMAWPAGLACFYPHPGANLELRSAVIALAVLAVITGAVIYWRERRYLTVGWLWYLGTMLPVIGFIQAGAQAHADRYTYLPLIGIGLMVTWAAADWAAERRQRRLILMIAALAVLGGLTAAAWRQTTFWRDSTSLWSHTVECTSGNPVAHNNLGTALVQNGHVEDAITQYQKALALDPDYDLAHNNLGGAFLQKGQSDDAVVHYQRALEITPDYADAHNGMGTALLHKGQVDAAVAHYRKALEFKPDDADASYNLGSAFLQKGSVDEAVAHYQKALNFKPDYAEAHHSLGNVFLQKGDMDEAMTHYQKALEITPHHARAQNNLGTVFLRKRQADDAITHFLAALEINPDYAEAHNNLGEALLQKGRTDEAIAHYQRALELKPEYADAHYNLGNGLLQKGQIQDALGHYESAIKINPTALGAQNNLAWVLATGPEASLRNGTRAVELAQEASRLSGGSHPVVLHTLAAAQAEAGRFAEAAETAGRALSLAVAQGDAALADAIRNERSLYLSGRPMRDTGSATSGGPATEK